MLSEGPDRLFSLFVADLWQQLRVDSGGVRCRRPQVCVNCERPRAATATACGCDQCQGSPRCQGQGTGDRRCVGAAHDDADGPSTRHEGLAERSQHPPSQRRLPNQWRLLPARPPEPRQGTFQTPYVSTLRLSQPSVLPLLKIKAAGSRSAAKCIHHAGGALTQKTHLHAGTVVSCRW